MSSERVIHGFTVTQAKGLTDEQRDLNRRWVEALRSGLYPQTRNALHDECGFCCLGVAATVAGYGWDKENSVGNYPIAGTGDTFVLPASAQADFGLPFGVGFEVTCDPPLEGDDEEYEQPPLAILNDHSGLSFSKIADLIAFWAGLEDEKAVGKEAKEGAA